MLIIEVIRNRQDIKIAILNVYNVTLDQGRGHYCSRENSAYISLDKSKAIQKVVQTLNRGELYNNFLVWNNSYIL